MRSRLDGRTARPSICAFPRRDGRFLVTDGGDGAKSFLVNYHYGFGHMRSRSITVAPGDLVEAGQTVGCVGNSGWTERPHLHMQAMRSATADWWHGDPLAMVFDGRFLARNQVVRV